MAVFAAVAAGAALSTLFMAAMRPPSVNIVRVRLQRLWAPETKREQGDPFSVRVLGPLREALTRSTSRLLPQGLIRAVETRIETADMTISAGPFVSLWLGVGVAMPAALLLLLAALGALSLPPVMLLGAWIVFGAIFPWRILSSRASGRTKMINRQLPDVIDMIVTSVEAGLGMQQAMLTVSEKFTGAIGDEFGRVLAETQMGRTRAEAMLDMAARSGSRDLMLFTRAVNQAEEMGFAIGRVLRVQSREIRERKEQSAREQAAKIPVKIIIPTTLFMLPTLFILILTPVILQAVEAFKNK